MNCPTEGNEEINIEIGKGYLSSNVFPVYLIKSIKNSIDYEINICKPHET